MRLPSLALSFLLATWASAGSFSVVRDRPGTWEATWSGDRWTYGGDPSGGWWVEQPGLPPAYHEGDLKAPRLRALLAMPAGSSWSFEILEDSGRILSSRTWARVPHMDPSTGRLSPAPISNPPERSDWTAGSVRLLSLDIPLAKLLPDGSLRVRTRLRVRATWNGAANPSEGTAWRNLVDNPGGIGASPALPSARRTSSSSDFPFDDAQAVVAVQVGDTSISSTLEDGVVRLTGAQLYQASGISPRTLRWSQVALWASNGDTIPSVNPSEPPSTALKLLPVWWKAGVENDSILNPDDELWFWARGTSIWKPDTALPGGWRFSIHPYSRTRRYYVVLGASKPSPILGAARKPSSPVGHATVFQPVWAGQPDMLLDNEYKEDTKDRNTGKSWFWQDLTTTSTLSASVFTWNSTANLPGFSGDSAWASLYVAPTMLSSSTPSQVDFQANGRSANFLVSDYTTGTWSVGGLSASGNRFSLAEAQDYFVVGYTLTYPRGVSTVDSAAFPAPAMGAISIPVRATGNCWVIEGGAASRRCEIANGSLRDSASDPDTWYAVFGGAPGSRPYSLSPILRASQPHVVTRFSEVSSADMVVISPDEFLDSAESYATWKGDSRQIRPMVVKVVRLRDVWDRWSGGAMDPAAIRNALRWFWSRWRISHALLLGGGHVDPRGLRNPKDPTLIPQWESGQVATDDFYAWFDTTGLHYPAIALGRVPARSLSEVGAWMDKLRLFEDPSRADLGPWRNTVLFAADDQWQGNSLDNLKHSEATSEIADVAESKHPWLKAERFYEQKYPRGAAFLKPTATQALVGYLNQGVVAFNYIGHGAPTILSDELLLDLPTFNRSVVNSTRPFFFYAGSCTVGRHDEPDQRGLGDLFVVTPGKGAFASIGGTRPTFSYENTELSKAIWDLVLDTTAAPRTLGEAVQGAKIRNHPSQITQIYDLYNILGDPAVVVFPRAATVSIDSLPGSLPALSKLSISGSSTLSGGVQLRLDQPMPADTFADAIVEKVSNSPRQLLAATTSISAGRFSTAFLLPARIPLGDSARMKAYVWDPSTRKDGGAVSAYQRLSGVGGEIPSDRTGPDLRIRSCDSSWTSGIPFGKVARVPLPFCLQVDLRDSSGISTSEDPDDGVVFSLTGVRDAWHPDVHQGADFRGAYAQLDLDSTVVQAGNTYTFQVAARDLMGNLSRGSVQIQPQAEGRYALYDVFASPNPVRDGSGTTFYYKLSADPDTNWSADTRIESSVRIHTVSGKLVRVLRTELSQASQSRPRATWDLKDSHGRPVANGLYPFTVTLRIPDASGTVTKDVVQRGIVAIAR